MTTDKLREALELILPMAKGYAAEHPVGANSRYVLVAEEALSSEPPTSDEGTPLSDAFYGTTATSETIKSLSLEDCYKFSCHLERTLQAKERELAAPQSGKKEGWQDIETAPKDGSEFVTCNMRQGGVKALVSWNRLHGYWQSKGDSIHMQATYWMPLPPAPPPATPRGDGSEGRYSEGIMGDGACILYDGQPVPIEDVVALLNAPQNGKKEDVQALYYELLYAVGQKYQGESRHQTALRYIQQAERQESAPNSSTPSKAEPSKA